MYDPPLEDGTVPSDRLRKLEINANAAFDQYREMWEMWIILYLLSNFKGNLSFQGNTLLSFLKHKKTKD